MFNILDNIERCRSLEYFQREQKYLSRTCAHFGIELKCHWQANESIVGKMGKLSLMRIRYTY